MDYEKIYQSLMKHRHCDGDGIIILNKVKKECKCSTEDILHSQSLHKVKDIVIGDRIVKSHTTIYDFGISHDDIRQSRIIDKNK